MGVSENGGTLFWGSLGSYYLRYYIRVPYFRKPLNGSRVTCGTPNKSKLQLQSCGDGVRMQSKHFSYLSTTYTYTYTYAYTYTYTHTYTYTDTYMQVEYIYRHIDMSTTVTSRILLTSRLEAPCAPHVGSSDFPNRNTAQQDLSNGYLYYIYMGR